MSVDRRDGSLGDGEKGQGDVETGGTRAADARDDKPRSDETRDDETRDGDAPQVPGQGGPAHTRRDDVLDVPVEDGGREGPVKDGSRAGAGVPAQREDSVLPPPRELYDGGILPPPRELPASDAELIERMRSGDDTAYEELYRRHADAVRRYARTCCRDAHTADDLTAEVFARMLQAVRGGSGPEYAVRAYLLTAVRRVAAGWTRSAGREQLVEDFAVFAAQAAHTAKGDDDTLELGADVRAMHEAEQSMAMRAFRSLPERWQAVLWHTEVEDESPSEVATLFGLDANGTRVLASRAREGLKQAYLQAHVSDALAADEECARYADQLGTYARGRLRIRAERGLRKHLEECARCRLAATQIKEVASGIPAVVPVAVIGWFGATFEVTGTTAMNIDVSEKVQSALVPYLLVVVGLAVILLLVVFRSILVPLKAAAGFLLSVLASLGAVVVVFQQGHGADLLGVETTGPIMSLMPIFLVGIVFGLAMDYEVFLVSRMREAYVHGERPAQAVTSGFRHSARVVVAAALIMIAVFSGFIGDSDAMIKMIGFGLASAVLLDAFVVRMAIVPAVLALLGERAWWLPKWLDRILPRVDVEGEALTRPAEPEAEEQRCTAALLLEVDAV
ncbi:sigma-70 family RNA polymerase sigma factor, partial [Streptomyces tendae]